MIFQDAIAVVRGQGERTESLCVRLAREQFERVELIRVAPFSEAVRTCYRIAIESGARWLVTIDADMLIAPDYAARMAPIIKRLPGSVWQVLGRVDDRLAMTDRPGGLRLHRVRTLPRLIDRVPADALRPESALCHEVGGFMSCSVVTCRHDYEQWYSDLHRKGAQHRVKHSHWGNDIVRRWKISGDPDLVAAWQGWHGKPLRLMEKNPL